MSPGARSSSTVALHHVALRVPDFDASLRFYTAGLGFAVLARWLEGGFPAAMIAIGGGTYIEVFGGAAQVSRPPAPLVHFAIRVPNCATALARAIDAGAAMASAPAPAVLRGDTIPYTARIAFCVGPGGEEIEFLESTDF